MMRIGVDLGGTKIEAIALDDDGVERARRRVPTPRDEGYQAIVQTVADLALAIERELAVVATVGVGTPGAIAPATGLLKNSNTVCLNGRPLDRDLGDALGRAVRVANDADCFALSEATDGAAAGAATVFGVIAGTGTGGGIVVHGRLLAGPNANAGEWGHNPLPWPRDDERPGPACYCRKHGCIETWLSGPAIAADHERTHGTRIDAEELARRREQGDRAAAQTLERHVDRFARALATVVNVVDPHVIVLGGGVSNLPGLASAIEARWAEYVFGATGDDRLAVRTAIVRAKHGDSSGVRGAAWLWPSTIDQG